MNRVRKFDNTVQAAAEDNRDNSIASVPRRTAKSFGEALYLLRTSLGMSQADMAKSSGLSRGYYSQLENSKRMPPPVRTVERLTAALGLPAPEALRLRRLANAGRCGMLVLPDEMPVAVAELVQRLADKALEWSEGEIIRISDAMTGRTDM